MLQARFQQKQLQEKEQKLLQLYDQQQQRAYQVVQRGSAGSRGSNGSNTVRSTTTSTTTATTTHTSSTSQGGKVRQMFDERRQTTVKGIDRSYPLEPLENKLRKQANTNGLATQKNGNVTVNRQSMKRVARADVNSNINGGKPVVSYHEEITRESFGPSMRRHIDDEDEYVLENRVATFGNGYYRHEDDNEQEEMLDQETMERNRMMAKIHLMGFDETLKHRVRNDLEGEEFPEYLMVDAPDKLSKRNVTKKLSQAEERLERFKNTNAKRSNMSKQSTSTRKRSEQVIPTKSNSRMTKSPSPESAMTKQRETNLRARGSTPSSPSKSPDVASRRTTAESRNQETKSSRRTTVARGADSIGNKAVDNADGIVYRNDSPNESTTRKSDAFTIDFDDRPSREDDAIPSKKSPIKKSNDKQQTASSASGRPTSSNSSVNLIQDSSAKGRMAESERAKGLGKGGGKNKGKGIEKPSSSNGKLANAPSFNEDATNDTKGLVKCKMCGRSFAQNRISLHEEICVKTMTKKRKQFDPVMSRVKGTELEPFVKKGLSKRETKTKKPETKTDWRRKHEDFINTIRYARETQARLAAGGNLNDLPPPPPSDTSDYVECEHCGRKFNRSAAERHIPICKRMHDKKQTQAPRAPRR